MTPEPASPVSACIDHGWSVFVEHFVSASVCPATLTVGRFGYYAGADHLLALVVRIVRESADKRAALRELGLLIDELDHHAGRAAKRVKERSG